MKDFFNWVFDFIVPWVNGYHPVGLSKVAIPSHFPNVMDIESLEITPKDNYMSFGMSPKFLRKSKSHHYIAVQEQPTDWQELFNTFSMEEVFDKTYMAAQLLQASFSQ